MESQVTVGQHVYDRNGDLIGRVQRVFVDEQTHEPQWLGVQVGDDPSEVKLVPVAEARELRSVLVPYSREKIASGPDYEANTLPADVRQQAESRYGCPSPTGSGRASRASRRLGWPRIRRGRPSATCSPPGRSRRARCVTRKRRRKPSRPRRREGTRGAGELASSPTLSGLPRW